MAILTKDQILNADDQKMELVRVPEWGGEVYVKSMTGLERDNFETLYNQEDGPNKNQNIRARLASATICDEKGELMFSNKDIEALGKRSASALDRVFEVAMRLSGISDKDVEELEKK